MKEKFIFNKLPNEIQSYIVSYLIDNCVQCDKSIFYVDENLKKCQHCKKKVCENHRYEKINHCLCEKCYNKENEELIEDVIDLFSVCRLS